ncbi:hypothetical protein AVHY2522_12310 [Acidovorax sp. SUPP2522]|uniref:hypothetical protein n=1 Tax=unclassified Acidovorax TaxID=2684926 RepID=UPI00234905AC|nr:MULTISPECIES: hypothetical protein [unclassified Acidovorax]WCM99300.1 hypothetical protein M5C96_07775 [Acidovorax sp. GBBC 1281]GKT16602.1 hypothetical protein AVHY2522_12310 [Acidovorax sp. SUPP2522]
MPLIAFVRAACVSSLLAAALPGHAELFTSMASSAGSAASSGGGGRDRRLAEGEYRVIGVEQVPGRPDATGLRLRATETGAAREFVLNLPRQAQGARPLAASDLLQARERPYGFEFARGDTREAFFLVLNDDWYEEMDSRPLAL